MEERITTDERLRREFNDWARAGKGPSMEQGHRPVGEQAFDLMNIPVDASILDVGCGSGWASRLMGEKASAGRVVGIDISDAMVQLSRESSIAFPHLSFEIASAEALPFDNGTFSHAFSMESLYYYADVGRAVAEIRRILRPGGMFVTVVDLYAESRASHQWVEQLNVPVQLLSTAQYRSLFNEAGFVNVRDQRIYDPRPVPDDYTSGSFATRDDYVEYRAAGSLMVSGEVPS